MASFLNNKILITGCARSGTGFFSELLTMNGLECGHEEAFNPIMSNIAFPKNAESSWFAAPYISKLDASYRIVHVSREPESVYKSLYRLGIFNNSLVHYLTQGSPKRWILAAEKNPVRAVKRFNYCCALRSYLKTHNAFQNQLSEQQRIVQYYKYWNKMIQESSKGKRYYHVRLSEFRKNIADLEGFLDLELKFLPGRVNRKQTYKRKSKIFF